MRPGRVSSRSLLIFSMLAWGICSHAEVITSNNNAVSDALQVPLVFPTDSDASLANLGSADEGKLRIPTRSEGEGAPEAPTILLLGGGLLAFSVWARHASRSHAK